MDVSIIIVNWNTCDLLRNCLQSIYAQTSDIQFEVIVIDNASSDETIEMIKSTFTQVILIKNIENKGFATANNQGLKIAKGRYVLLLNPDTFIIDRAIQNVIKYADMHPEAAVVGCQVLLNSNEIQKTCFQFPSLRGIIIQLFGLHRIFKKSHFINKESYGNWDRQTARDVDVVSGMFMLVKKIAIEKVGLMDESFFVYAEETDWCYRFWLSGWKCIFTPVARIIHIHGGSKSTEQVKTKMFVQMQKSMLIFFRKHYGISAWLIAKLLYILSLIIRILSTYLIAIRNNNESVKQKLDQFLAALRFHLTGVFPE